MRSLLFLSTALTAATSAVAQSWTQTVGSDGTTYDVLLLNPPGDTDPLILLDYPSTGQIWYFNENGFGSLTPGSGHSASSSTAPTPVNLSPSTPAAPPPAGGRRHHSRHTNAAPSTQAPSPTAVPQGPETPAAQATAANPLTAAATTPASATITNETASQVSSPPPAATTAPAELPAAPPTRATVQGSAPICATSGSFSVSPATGFTDPNRNPWNMRGLNAGVQDALNGFPNVLSDYPGLSAIRLNINPSVDSQDAIDQVVLEYAGSGIAVEIEDHSGSQTNVAFYQKQAEIFADNPLVFLEMPNEPGGSAQQVAQNDAAIISAIRAAGFKNPIGLQPDGGYDQSDIPLITAEFGTSGFYVTPHIYYSGTDPNAPAQYVQSEIQQASSNGLYAVIDEFGNAEDGFTANPEGMNVIQAVTAANNAGRAGAIFWAMDNGNHANGADSVFLNPSGIQLSSVGSLLQSWLSSNSDPLSQGKGTCGVQSGTAPAQALAADAPTSAISPVFSLGPALSLAGGMTTTAGSVTPANSIGGNP